MLNPYYRKLLPGMIPRGLSTKLTLVDAEAIGSIVFASGTGSLELEQALAFQGEYAKSITDELSLSGDVLQVRDLPLSVTSDLEMLGSASNVRLHVRSISDEDIVSQAIEELVHFARTLESESSLTDEGTRTIVQIPTGLEQLLLTGSDHDAYYKTGQTHLVKDYSPGQGDFRLKRQGYAIHLDGSNDYAITDSAVLSPAATDMSISLWVKMDTLGNPSFIHINNVAATDVTGSLVGYSLSAEKFMFNFLSAGTIISTLAPAINTWYHIVATFDTAVSTAELKIYINGSLDKTVTSITPTALTGAWYFGRGVSATRYLDGWLSDIRAYDKILTADEVTYLYNAGTSGTDPTETDLVAHWPMQDEDGTILHERISSNHATLTNAVTSGVGSVHQPLADVKQCYANESGFSTLYNSDGTSSTKILVLDDVTSMTNVVVEFWIQTTKATGILFGNNAAAAPFFGCWDANAATTSASVVSMSIEVDDTPVADDRRALRDAINDGEVHKVKLTVGSLANFTNGLWLSGYLSSTYYILGELWGLTINGTPVDFDTVVPASSSTTDALGGTLPYQGRVPRYGLIKDFTWKGDASTMGVTFGSILPATGDFSLSFPYKPASGTDNYRVFSHYKGSLATSVEILQNADGSELKIHVGTSGQDKTIAVPTGEYSVITLSRSGNTFTLSCSNGNTVSHTQAVTLDVTANTRLFSVAYDYLFTTSGNIGPVTFVISGVTTTFAPIPGTRHVAKLPSNAAGEIVYSAVVNGTLADLYELGDGSWRSPNVENGCRWISQNRLVRSETFTGWTLQSGALSANDTTLIDELNDARKLSGTTSAGLARIVHVTPNITLTAATEYTLSVYVKEGTHSVIELGVYQTPSNILEFRWYDLSDGTNGITFDNFTAGAISATLVGDGWYRVSLTFTPPNSQTSYFYIGMKGTSMNSSTNVYIGGAQLNIGATAQDYERTLADAWNDRVLVPAPKGSLIAATGRPVNIPANKLPRTLEVDRTGGVIEPLDYLMETDGYTGEVYDDTTTETTVDKRVETDYSDRLGASLSDISGESFFD